MLTISGNAVPFPDTNDQPVLMDMVRHLGRTMRFGGVADPEWTVQGHSLLTACVYLINYGTKGVEHALLHDFHESYIGDIPSPIKKIIGPEAIKEVEAGFDKKIFQFLKVKEPSKKEKEKVKICDIAALIIESYYVGVKGHMADIVVRDFTKLDPNFIKKIRLAVEKVDDGVHTEFKRLLDVYVG